VAWEEFRTAFTQSIGQNGSEPCRITDEMWMSWFSDHGVYTRKLRRWQSSLSQRNMEKVDMDRLILHVGMHKTATSSIQKTLAANAHDLMGQGFHYPIFVRDGTKIDNHSIPVFSLFSDNPKKYHINFKLCAVGRLVEINEGYRQQLSRALEQECDVIISGEDISVLSKEGLKNFYDFISKFNKRVELYCAVRRPYSLACSAIQEGIKNGSVVLEDMVAPQRSKNIDTIKRVFSNEDINFYNFEAECQKSEGPVLSFLNRVGVDAGNFEWVSANAGLGNVTTRLYAHLNILHPVIKDGKLYEKPRSRKTINIDDNKFLLTAGELDRIREGLDVENARLRLLLGEEFTDKNYPVSEPFSLTREKSHEIYRRFCKPAYVSPSLIAFIENHADCSLFELGLEYNSDVEFLRDIAVHLEGKKEIGNAFELMTLAHDARPDGSFIKKKVREYKVILENG
jgi:hypothetical protein